jgi:hypothetical protein
VALQFLVTRTAKIAARAERVGRVEPSSRAEQLPLLKRRELPPIEPSFASPPRSSTVRVDRGRRPRAARLTPVEARRAIRWMTILEPCGGRSP